jgi:ribonuclease E
MEVSFEPKEGLMAGHFELERTRVRDPEDRPRNHAVSIEAGFVPSNEPEDEIAPEEEDEEIEESEESVEPKSSETPDAPAARDGEGGRRRRRRGGRGRNRDRGPRPEGLSQEAAPPESRAADENGQADAPQASTHQASTLAPEASNGQLDNGDFAASGNGQQAPGDGGRRRRRRRGRRGGRNRDQDNQDHGSLAPEAERFGVPEEIDTTPVSGHAPGASSAPVWSLQDDIPDTTPVADGAQDQSDKPVKKGWWQRAFSNDK